MAALDAQIAQRLAQAEQADQTDRAEQLPPELTDAAARRAKLQAARAALQKRSEQEKREPDDDDLGNTTDPESRPQKTSHGYIQGYNAQIAATADGLIVAAHVCSENQDRRQLLPTMHEITAQGFAPHTVVADTGYDSHEQITTLETTTGAAVYIPPQLPVETNTRQNRSRVARSMERQARLARVRSPSGQALLRQRRITVEPIFGIIKAARRFDRFLLRGRERVAAEWTLICTAFNLLRIHRLLAQRA